MKRTTHKQICNIHKSQSNQSTNEKYTETIIDIVCLFFFGFLTVVMKALLCEKIFQ